MFYKWHRGHTQLFWDDKDQQVRQQKLNNILEKYFGQCPDGTFVEIGANNGIDCGITTPLADLGWLGFYIEPDKNSWKECVVNHLESKNIKCYNFAISDRSEKVFLYIAGMGSTTSSEYYKVAKKISWTGLTDRTQTIEVPAISLNTFLTTAKVKPGFEILSIDTEGSEYKILKAFNFKFWAPKMILIELGDEHPDLIKYKNLLEHEKKTRSLIEAEGYVLLHKDEVNSLYVHPNILNNNE